MFFAPTLNGRRLNANGRFMQTKLPKAFLWTDMNFPKFWTPQYQFYASSWSSMLRVAFTQFFQFRTLKEEKRSYHRLHLLIYKSPVLTKEVASKHVSINFSKYLALLLTRSLYFLWWKSPRTCYRYLNKGSLNASLLSHVPLILDINNLVWYVAMRFLRFSQR